MTSMTIYIHSRKKKKTDSESLCRLFIAIIQKARYRFSVTSKTVCFHCTKSSLWVQHHPKEFLLPLYKNPITGSAYPKKTIIAIIQKGHYRFNVIQRLFIFILRRVHHRIEMRNISCAFCLSTCNK